MKTLFLLLSLLTLPLLADTQAFLAESRGIVLQEEGECHLRHSPCSTFKVAISLMGFDAGLLIDETHPEISFEQGFEDYLPVWRQAHNPTLWLKNGCLWFSQVITKQMGLGKFQDYLARLDYGNQDSSGDVGKGNGLTRSWLSSSLQISVKEQVAFLRKLLAEQLPVSEKAHQMTKKIMFLEEWPDGWKLYGKTGSGCQLSADRTTKLDLQIGWFIGWLENGANQIVFAQYIEEDSVRSGFAGQRAKDAAKMKLNKLISIVDSLK